jgi:hypothetical protein
MMLHSLNHVAGVHDVDKLSLFLASQMGSCDMRFALAGGQRVEAYAGGRGSVAVVMAKLLPNAARTESPTGRTGECGIVIWAEKETDWHRAWKNNFPAECQEFIQHDGQSGEKHIADVRTLMAL